MITDVFQEVRERISALDAAHHYGLEVNRTGFTPCIFHHEKTASLKLYPGTKGFYCFGCHTGGSIIDLVAQLFGLDALGAVKKLDADFHMCLPLDRQQTPQERREAARAAAKQRELSDIAQLFEAWRSAMLDKLTAVFRMAHLALKDCQTLDDLSEAEALAVKWQAAAEYWADCLLSGDMAAQMDIFRDRKGVDALCDQILNSMQAKSRTA